MNQNKDVSRAKEPLTRETALQCARGNVRLQWVIPEGQTHQKQGGNNTLR